MTREELAERLERLERKGWRLYVSRDGADEEVVELIPDALLKACGPPGEVRMQWIAPRHE